VTPRAAGCALAIALLGGAPAARAESTDATTRADALFESAKVLRAGGRYPEACEAFAESKRLASGVGISLYLADCYEHLGKNALAWAEFREAEAHAREKHDKRADVARARGAALGPLLGHIGVAIPLAAEGVEVRIDGGESLAPATWTAVPVDPGRHEVTLRIAGKVVRTASAQVERGRWAIVRFDIPQVTLSSGIATSSTPERGADRPDPRRVLEYSLIAAGGAAVAAGVGFLAQKNESMANGGPVDSRAAIGSDVAFGIGGAALVAAVLVYLTAPAPKDTAIVVAPVPLTGGAGAFLSARF
jgi:hypothetical protein